MSTSSVLRLSSLPLLFLLAAGCGSSAPSGPVGGFVTGAEDLHCGAEGGVTAQAVGVCMPDGDEVDGGAPSDDGGAPEEDYPAPLYGSEGYDDDCKYKVSVAATPVRKDQDVTFTVTIDELDPAKKATGANLYAEVTLGDAHVAPNTGTKTTEKGSGVYQLGPVKFDQAGEWTVRFHMFGECSDTPEDSPHAHIAFRINVP